MMPREGDPVVRVRAQNAARQVNAFREEARNIELISRYETRIIRNGARLNAELKELQNDRTGQVPDLGFDQPFDEAGNEAIAWYKRLVARSEALLKARQEYEDYQAAQRAANRETAGEADTAPNATQTPASASASDSPPASNPDSFRKMPPRLTAHTVPAPPLTARQQRAFTEDSLWSPGKIAA
jgi:hypothetical protein